MEKDVELELIEEEELLAGLLSLTSGNLGAAYSLLEKAKKETVKAVKAAIQQAPTPLLDQSIKENARQATLQKLDDNLEQEVKRARRRAQYALNRNLRDSSHHPAKPKDTAGHHIAAATEPRAEKALRILLAYDISPNDEANGVNLPRFARHTPHSSMPNAISHAETHTNDYYGNVEVVLLNVADVPGATREDVVKGLRDIGRRLQAGTFPIREVIDL